LFFKYFGVFRLKIPQTTTQKVTRLLAIFSGGQRATGKAKIKENSLTQKQEMLALSWNPFGITPHVLHYNNDPFFRARPAPIVSLTVTPTNQRTLNHP